MTYVTSQSVPMKHDVTLQKLKSDGKEDCHAFGRIRGTEGSLVGKVHLEDDPNRENFLKMQQVSLQRVTYYGQMQR